MVFWFWVLLFFFARITTIFTTNSSAQYLMSSPSLPINIILLKFPSCCLHLKLHTSFPHSFRHSCSDPIPDVNLTSYDSSTINSLTFSTAIMTSSTFRTKTCTTLKINVVENLVRIIVSIKLGKSKLSNLASIATNKSCGIMCDAWKLRTCTVTEDVIYDISSSSFL